MRSALFCTYDSENNNELIKINDLFQEISNLIIPSKITEIPYSILKGILLK
jgi:hypothetical protein